MQYEVSSPPEYASTTLPLVADGGVVGTSVTSIPPPREAADTPASAARSPRAPGPARCPPPRPCPPALPPCRSAGGYRHRTSPIAPGTRPAGDRPDRPPAPR